MHTIMKTQFRVHSYIATIGLNGNDFLEYAYDYC